MLVVHDRKEAAAEVRKVLLDDSAATDVCDMASDYRTARTLLASNIYDLLVLDLTIPLSPTMGSPTYQAAEMLLDDLFNSDQLHPPGDIIGITKHEEVLKLVGVNLGPHLMVIIPEDRDGKWRDYLRDKVQYARRAAHTRSVSMNQNYDYDALIVTAMDAEMEPYEALLQPRPFRHFKMAKEFLFADCKGNPRRGIAYAIGRSGQPSAASMTQALITYFRPRVALMSGYCGGVRGKVNLGDLVFFEAAYAWDYGKWAEEGKPPSTVFLARPDPISIVDHPLHDAARGYCRSRFASEPEVAAAMLDTNSEPLSEIDTHLKPVASGSAVVASDEIVTRIRGLNDSMWAVDMEAYGFYHAASHTRAAKPDFLCVKSVSDFSNGEKGDEYHSACSRISAELVHRLLTRDWDFDDRTWSYDIASAPVTDEAVTSPLAKE